MSRSDRDRRNRRRALRHQPRAPRPVCPAEPAACTAAAQAAGKSGNEIVPITVKMKKLDKATGAGKPGGCDRWIDDECNRPDTTLEGLAALKPVHHGRPAGRRRENTSRPDNSSQFSDGGLGGGGDERRSRRQKESEAAGHFPGLRDGRRRARRNGHRPHHRGATPSGPSRAEGGRYRSLGIERSLRQPDGLLHGQAQHPCRASCNVNGGGDFHRPSLRA